MKKLYEGNIRKNFFFFAFPLVFSILFSQAYHIINTIMASHFLGDSAISAIGSTAAFISFISSVFWGYAAGFSVYVAVLFGRGDYPKMLNVIKLNIFFSSLVVLGTAVLCLVFHEQIFDFLNIEEALRKDAFAYFGIYMAGLIFLHINWCSTPVSYAIGVAKLPFIASVLTNLLNIVGNYIFLRFAGFGVGGTALATVLSAGIISAFYLVMFIRMFRKENIPIKGFYLSKEEIRVSWEYGFPSMLQQSVMYLCTMLVSPLTNQCGASAIAGYTVGMRLYDLNAGVYQNATKTVSNYIAQCMGAKKFTLITKGIRIGLTQTLLFLLPFLLTTVFGADFISRIFLTEPQSIYYARIFMQYCMPFVLFNVINNLLHGIFRNTGAGHFLVIATVVYSAARFFFSYLFFGTYEMYGIYLAVVLAWVTEAVFGLILYFSGKWKNQEYREAMELAKQSA